MNGGNKIQVGAWEWTSWPTMPLPDEDWLRRQGQAKGARWVDDYNKQREMFIAQEQHDPLSYGWEQPCLKLLRQLIAGTYQPGRLGVEDGGDPASGLSVGLVAADWKLERAANDVVLLGGNGSGKTEVQAKIAMECVVEGDNREVRCFSATQDTSINYIQKAMYRYLPPPLRRIKSQGVTTKISYKAATGFSDDIFVLPNRSTGRFPTYKAWSQDPMSIEGGECDIVTWDEEAPSEMMETVRFRAHKKGGIVIGGFTPILGYSATVGQYIEGGKILECIPARRVVWDWNKRTWGWGEWLLPEKAELVKGCPPGHVPLVVQSGQGGGRRFAVVFPTMFNPYTDVASIIESASGKGLNDKVEHKLERLWGWPTKKVRPSFPTFGESHIVQPERIPKDLTVHFWTDPHGDRNWFMLWLGVDEGGTIWIIDEWPDVEIGEWSMPGSKVDGKVGPGQTMGHGKSFNDYKRLILSREGWTVNADGVWALNDAGERDETRPGAWGTLPVDRRMDPRPAGTSVPSDEQAQTYLDYMNDPIRDVNGKILLPAMDFAAGPDCSIEEGKQWINDWLSKGWDPNKPVTPLNCPKFYVSARCENLIWSLRTWTGADGIKGASKDPIDCLKGLAKMGVEYRRKGMMMSHGGGSY